MSDDLLQVARWVANGTLAPWAVEDKTVMQMARKLLEALDAVEAEREACARVCDEFLEFGSHASEIAASIRARGAK